MWTSSLDEHRDLNTIDDLIDRYDLAGVIRLMAEACAQRAESWADYDRSLADEWTASEANLLQAALLVADDRNIYAPTTTNR